MGKSYRRPPTRDVRDTDRNTRHRSETAGQSEASSAARRRLIALTAILGLLIVAFVLVRVFRERLASVRPASGPDGSPGALAPLPEPAFESPAFSPQATADDLKQEAVRTVEELLEAFPSDRDALRAAARLQAHLGDSNAAALLWKRCAAADPSCAEAYLNLGRIADRAGEFPNAAELYGQAAALEPQDPHAPALQADALMKSGQVAEAVTLLEAHADGRVLGKALLTLGQGYLLTNQLEKAGQTFQKLTAADPDEARAFYGLAKVYARLGQAEESRKNLEKFQRLAAVDHEELADEKRAYEDVPMLRGLLAATLAESGRVARQHGDKARAEECWQKAAALQPQDLPSRYALLTLYEEEHRDRDALQVCQQLCRYAPQRPDHWLFLGLLRDRLGQSGAAADALRQACRLDPGNPKYEQALARVAGPKE